MDWIEQNGNLVRSFKLKSFSAIIEKLSALASKADQMAHHPDFSVTNYNEIKFKLYTHDANAITNLDYQLANEIDSIFNQ